MSGQKRLIYFLPNIFTCLNMACGYGALMLTLKHNFYMACIFLLLGAIFDSVDGRIARLTGTSSHFGEQFDSMSDLISFGMAPSFIFYQKFLVEWNRVGMVLSFFFLLCGALRLARFNANIDKVNSDYFQGMPIPLSALGLVGFVLITLEYPLLVIGKWFPLIYIFICAILMISNIPFPSFKDSQWVKNHKKQILLIIFFMLALIMIYETIMIEVYFIIYLVGTLFYYMVNHKKLKGIFKSEAK